MHKTISQLLAAAGEGPDRVAPSELSHEMAAGALAVDIGPARQRDHYGKISGAMIIDPNVLEWRLDPSSPNRIPEMIDYDRRIVIVCQEGYASSLATATLQELGLHRATDLAGGFRALLGDGEL